MTAKRSRGGAAAAKKKRYYNPPSAMDKIRHRLADGTPTHKLLHYLHGCDKLPADVRDLAEAAEQLHQVATLLDAVTESSAVKEVGNGAKESCQLLTGNEIRAAIKKFTVEARKVLLVKTMKEPEES